MAGDETITALVAIWSDALSGERWAELRRALCQLVDQFQQSADDEARAAITMRITDLLRATDPDLYRQLIEMRAGRLRLDARRDARRVLCRIGAAQQRTGARRPAVVGVQRDHRTAHSRQVVRRAARLHPLWSVTDALAMQFSRAFYGALLRPESPATLAEAVWHARTAIRQPDDPTWLAYSLFAHPNATVAL